jgi:hypothetical protein
MKAKRKAEPEGLQPEGARSRSPSVRAAHEDDLARPADDAHELSRAPSWGGPGQWWDERVPGIRRRRDPGLVITRPGTHDHSTATSPPAKTQGSDGIGTK